MTTQFLSRVEREISKSAPSSDGLVGPGAYDVSSGSKILPGFVPFSTSSKRSSIIGKEDLSKPSPGLYNISEDMSSKKNVASSAFKSGAKRFSESLHSNEPGPGQYALKSSISSPKAHIYKPSHNPLELIQTKGPAPPSIPAKTQSHGYEVTMDGRVVPQPPAIPGYSGIGQDSVGPADYNPKISVKFKNIPRPNFSKAPERSHLDRMAAKVNETPGPGYYDTPSTFDLNPTGNAQHDNDFLVHLNAAKKRHSSSFESKTARDALLKEIERRKYDPGPGYYELPKAIEVKTKPPNQQFFTTSEERFKDPQPRSNRILTAPGEYNPITSEFDLMKIKIMKQKKASSRSNWAQNIAFTSTERRFNQTFDNEVPSSTSYYPRTGISDNLRGPNVRGGAFGCTESRFKDEMDKPTKKLTREQEIERELNQEIASILNKPSIASTHEGSPDRNFHSVRPKFSSVFAPSSSERLRPIKSPPGPSPGAYEVGPKWNTAQGVVLMAPPVVTKKKKPETMPGPGQYALNRELLDSHQIKNRKNIMLYTGGRSEITRKSASPGPGYYEPAPFIGSMIKPTHNILLSEKYQ